MKDIQDEIEEFNGYAQFDVDKTLTQQGEEDSIRVTLTKSLMIETELYNTYVNTIKHLLSKELNKKERYEKY